PREIQGYHTMVSPDGLTWRRSSARPIAPGRDVVTGYYDEARRLYVAFPKIATAVRGHSRRVFYQVTSRDFKNWTEPRLVFAPDLRDDAGSLARIERVRPLLDVPDNPAEMRTEFYGIGAYVHESCTLAFPWVFTINNRGRYGNQDGPMEVQLAVTRDLVDWDRQFRTPCLPLGEVGEWDCGMVYTQSRALRVGDEIRLYYGGHNGTHGCPCFYRTEGTGRGTKFSGGIGLATWKLDRFVSADGASRGGTLTTVPLVFSGERLEVNVRVKPGGSVTVQLLDSAERPIQGFGRSGSVRGDHLRAPVVWPGSRKLAELRGRPV